MLTPDFSTVNNLFKMASNGEVFYINEFRIVDMNIFEVWAIAIRSHLEGRSCVRSTQILYSEHYSADYAPQDGLIWETFLHELSSSRRIDRL